MNQTYSPIYDKEYTCLPRDRKELNDWNQHFYSTDIVVKNAIDLHTIYSTQGFYIKCKNSKIYNFFQTMSDNINLTEIIKNVALGYWKLGEAFPEAELDKTKGVWKKIYIHNPSYIDMKQYSFSDELQIVLIPDDKTRQIIKNPNPDDIAIRSQIDPDVIEYVMTGQNIPLNNFNVASIINKESPCDKRGTSIIEPAFKDLLLLEKNYEKNSLKEIVSLKKSLKQYLRGNIDTMQKQYENLQLKISTWIEKKLFRPISEIQEFRTDDYKFIVPTVHWKPLNLRKNKQYLKERN